MTRDRDAEFDEETVRRVESCLADMGWDEADLAKEIYGDLGYATIKGVTHWFNRSRKIPRRGLAFTASFLGIDIAYFMQTRDDLDGCVHPRGRYALATKSRKQAI